MKTIKNIFIAPIEPIAIVLLFAIFIVTSVLVNLWMWTLLQWNTF